MYRFLLGRRNNERDHGSREHDASLTKSQMVSLTWAPFARVIIAKAKKLGGQGVTCRRTLPRYVSKTSNISRPVEHPERAIRLPTLRPPPLSTPRYNRCIPVATWFPVADQRPKSCACKDPIDGLCSDWQAWRNRTMCGISKIPPFE